MIAACALLPGWRRADAQLLPSDDFFHAGAMAYLSNNIPAALERVTNGLAIYPNDEKLKKLEELLKQQQQQNQQNQKQQQNQQQNNQSKQDQQKQKQDQEKQEKDQQKSEQEKQKEEKQKRQQQKKDQAEQQAKEPEDQQQKPEEQQAIPGQMTPQEAKRLLDAQKNDEMMMPFNRPDKPKKRTVPLKDW